LPGRIGEPTLGIRIVLTGPNEINRTSKHIQHAAIDVRRAQFAQTFVHKLRIFAPNISLAVITEIDQVLGDTPADTGYGLQISFSMRGYARHGCLRALYFLIWPLKAC